MHPTWTDQLPEALRTDANYAIFDKYDTIGAFAENHLTVNGSFSASQGEMTTLKEKIDNLTTNLGKRFEIPTDETDEETKAKFYSALGVPATAKDYGVDEELGKEFLKLGLTKAQGEMFVKSVESEKKAEQEAHNTTVLKAVTEYQEKLGDKKDVTYKLANDALQHFYSKEDLEQITTSVMNSPKMIDVHSKIGALLQERPGLFATISQNQGTGNLYESMKDE